jgi:hypothetical protein
MAKAIEHEVFVDFIGNCNHVMLHAKVADDREFLLGEHPAGRIVRRIEEHGLGLLLKRARQFFSVKAIVRWTQRNPDRTPPGERDTRMIVFVGRLQNHDFFAGIDDA